MGNQEETTTRQLGIETTTETFGTPVCQFNSDLDPSQDERRILEDARDALISLKRTFEQWRTMGRGLQLLREKADCIGRRNTFDDLREQAGLGEKQGLKRSVASKLLRVMSELDAVEKWRATLTAQQKLEWSSPSAILKHCPCFNRLTAAAGEPKTSPYAKLQQAHVAVLEENDRLKRRSEEGSLFDLKNDTVEIIADTIVGNVSPGRAEKIARAILKAIKTRSQKPAG
jgi:hypothetical protein